MILSSNTRWSHLSPITRLIFHNLHMWDLLRYSGISFNQEMSFPRVLLVLRSTVLRIVKATTIAVELNAGQVTDRCTDPGANKLTDIS